MPERPREILQNGALGRLVPVGDWRALGEAILATFDSPLEPKRLIKGASDYSAESSVGRYFDLVNELSGRDC